MPRTSLDAARTRQSRQHKQQQRDALRERILKVSRGIVKREGLASLSMRKLAEAIDYSPAALYLHFRSRGEIAQALRKEGHAQLRIAFAAHTRIADAADRLRAVARAYVEFGLSEPETYRLMFMDSTETPDDNAAMLSLIADAFVELRAANRLATLPASAAPAACARAFWANLHGITALQLNGAACADVPAAELVELSLAAWLAAC
ncbi:TetR/AcrR family transcriptional regulator [Caballeronia sp. LZ062]|uniref:TetR/AcrR family transcriptional regulator n=1 Tax=unclassified Caballeronia TaxID=2646786 RepID=UPI002857C12C|nr:MULTISPECIES: TetR/AcrR family transcriptional regulator [unclassified Caballeronia]MDR5854408.1 TetR/AcrR family transcriptional regulator [Caballeronia sp. LZ050]MDR5871061.1 TetR/AcrR family transcriptional regulator [Caballeronia sp. LZ062]